MLKLLRGEPRSTSESKRALANERQLLQSLLASWPEEPDRFRSHCAAVPDGDACLCAAAEHGVLGVLAEPLAAELCVRNAQLSIALQERVGAQRLWQNQIRQSHSEARAALHAAGIR